MLANVFIHQLANKPLALKQASALWGLVDASQTVVFTAFTDSLQFTVEEEAVKKSSLSISAWFGTTRPD